MVLKADEACQYGFNGKPLKDSKALKNRNDRIKLRKWILSHLKDLDEAWEDVNNGKKLKMIED